MKGFKDESVHNKLPFWQQDDGGQGAWWVLWTYYASKARVFVRYPDYVVADIAAFLLLRAGKRNYGRPEQLSVFNGKKYYPLLKDKPLVWILLL